ncbi:MAG: hypothetical protein KatS3mg111_0992 [Pirellulaceae bacterium]|nr:MAG: hypothetical protein KatS3mg111_0992 [Pirellulaceae bacterium]
MPAAQQAPTVLKSWELVVMSTTNRPQPRKADAPSRKFLGLKQPILWTVVDELMHRYQDGAGWDMRGVVVVLPTQAACRRLRELLAGRASEHGGALLPPHIITVGSLPERLYVPRFPFANGLVQELAWMDALRSLGPTELQLLAPSLTRNYGVAQWQEFARTLARLHRDLASDRMDFSHVLRVLGRNHPEYPRWEVLAQVQQAYLHRLDELELWDIQTARMRALDFDEVHTDERFHIVACVDMNRTQRGFVAAAADAVEIWIAAEEKDASLFDELGCVVAEQWTGVELTIDDGELLVGNSPIDQAELAVACVQRVSEGFTNQQITLGVPDASLVPHLKRQLHRQGLPARYAGGIPLRATEPGQLLVTVADYLRSDGEYETFARLVRHPAVEQMLTRGEDPLPSDYLVHLDSYYTQTLPPRAEPPKNMELHGAKVVEQLIERVEHWLAPLKQDRLPVDGWIEPIKRMLQAAYDRRTSDPDDPHDAPCLEATVVLATAIDELANLPPAAAPQWTSVETLDWLLQEIGEQGVPEARNPQALEMVGWLELPLDDAPVAIIAGMHDGVVPHSINADAFLPNSLRRQLGMEDNDRRLARDLYVLRTVLQTRRWVRLIAGKVDEQGDPLVPSRLLLACPLEQLPARIVHLTEADHVDRLPLAAPRADHQATAARRPLTIPRPEPDARLDAISVTAFRSYLACPYRFYLRYVKRLREVSDEALELDAGQFGDVVHWTLEEFGRQLPTCRDVRQIEEFLLAGLRQQVKNLYGDAPSPGVVLQMAQAEQRLRWFAQLQAERASEGWEIHHVELGVGQEDALWIGEGEERLKLVGRIDRIDYHPKTGRWAIWDYKTSGSGKRPEETHRQAGEWIDLQLPLYRWLAEHRGVDLDRLESVGYIILGKAKQDCSFAAARFTDADFQEADALATQIAAAVARGEFWPRDTDGPREVEFDDFPRVCQVGVRRFDRPPSPRRQHVTRETELGRPAAEVVQEARDRLRAQPERQRPPLPPKLIRASAGTGKTFQLSNRLLSILLSGQDVDGILATTFTRKAAGEIAARVLERLATACLDETMRDELQRHVEGGDVSAANCLVTLKRLACSLHRLRIATLDAYFGQIGQAMQFELALPAGWEILDPAQQRPFELEAVRLLVHTYGQEKLETLLQLMRKGETGTRIADDLHQVVQEGFGLWRCTTRAAWDQLPLRSPPSDEEFDAALQTIEAVPIGHKTGDRKRLELITLAHLGEWETLLEATLLVNALQEEPKYQRKALPPELVLALRVLWKRAVYEELVALKRQTLATADFLQAFDTVYQRLTHLHRRLSFADVTDVLGQWTRRFRGSQNLPGNASADEQVTRALVEHRLDCSIHHLLLDEFQDTSPVQWQILQPLAQECARQDGRRSLFCVGDTKQAIYGWRGGVAEVFDAVKRAVPACTEISLDRSYRSSQIVLDVVNEVFRRLPEHTNYLQCDAAVHKFATAFPQHVSERNDLTGYVCITSLTREQGEKKAERTEKLLHAAAQQIADLVRATSASIGVLLRKNEEVDHMIAALRALGVEASHEGGSPLSDAAAVQWVQSVLHVADHPGDKTCAFHVFSSSLADQLPDPVRGSARRLSQWIRDLTARRGFVGSIEALVDLIQPHVDWWDAFRLEQLCQMAIKYAPYFDGRLRKFEKWIDEQDVALPTDAQVKVMTVHKSKGLEFDAVVLPLATSDLASQGQEKLMPRFDDPCEPPDGVLRYVRKSLRSMLPPRWQQAFATHMERKVIESLCVWYVAMTRARRALYVLAPQQNSLEASFAGILHSLFPAADSSQDGDRRILVEHGQRHWFADLPPSSENATIAGTQRTKKASSDASPASENALPSAERPAARFMLRNVPLRKPSHVAASNQQHGRMGRAFAHSDPAARAVGTLLHALLADVQWIDDYHRDRQRAMTTLQRCLASDGVLPVELDKVIDTFHELVDQPRLRGLLSRQRYDDDNRPLDAVEVFCERPLLQLAGEELLVGTIDRLVLLRRDGKAVGAEVIDFKTDAVPPTKKRQRWLTDMKNRYQQQLETYAAAIGATHGLSRHQVRCTLMLLLADEVIEF